MSDTPRTDAVIARDTGDSGLIAEMASESRQLERELNAANDRIKRLEEAGDALERDKQALKKILADMGVTGTMGFGSTVKWAQAKEDKL